MALYHYIFSVYPTSETTDFLLSPFNDDPKQQNWKIHIRSLLPGLKLMAQAQTSRSLGEKLADRLDSDHDGLITPLDLSNEIMRQFRSKIRVSDPVDIQENERERKAREEMLESVIVKKTRKIMKTIFLMYEMNGLSPITTDEFIARTNQNSHILEFLG